VRINHATLPLQSFLVNGTQTFSIGANSGGGGSFYYGTGNVTAATIDSSGRLLVGTATASSGEAQYSRFVVQGAGTNPGVNAHISLLRGQNLATTPVSAGVAVGLINFGDSAGNPFAFIEAETDGTTASGDYPGRLVFSTTADGAASPTERLRIDSSGRVGIGTSAPSASALLDVNGNARIGSAGNFDTDTRLLVANTGGNSYIQIQGADSTGTVGLKLGRNSVANRAGIDWSASTDKLTLRTGGTSAAVTIDSSQRVGIGTSSLRQVAGATANVQAERTGAGGGAALSLLTNSSSGVPASLLLGASRGAAGTPTSVLSTDIVGLVNFFGADGTDYDKTVASIRARAIGTIATDRVPGQLEFYTAENNIGSTLTQRLTIDNTGRVGIGTTSPSQPLDIYSSQYAGLGFKSARTTAADNIGGPVWRDSTDTIKAYIQCTVDGQLKLGTGGSTERARIDSSGRLLVGTSSSYANADVDELQIGNNSSATKTGITLGSTDQSGIAFADASNARAGMIEYTHSIDSLRFYTNGTNERMRINSGGAVVFWSQLTFAPSGTKAFEITYNAADFYITNADFSNYAYLSGQNFTGWSFASDARIKENIQDLEYGINQLKALKPRRFNFIGQDSSTIGFIAQEVQAVVPEAVTGKEIPYEETDTLQEKASKTLSITKEALIPLLTKALQEAIAKIETLEGMVAVNNITIDEQQHQISALADRLTALEAQ
jgi:hypothetical protein